MKTFIYWLFPEVVNLIFMSTTVLAARHSATGSPVDSAKIAVMGIDAAPHRGAMRAMDPNLPISGWTLFMQDVIFFRESLALTSNYAKFQVFLFCLFEVFLGVVLQIFGNSKSFLPILEDFLQAVVVLS
jgi:hypothetical protein